MCCRGREREGGRGERECVVEGGRQCGSAELWLLSQLFAALLPFSRE